MPHDVVKELATIAVLHDHVELFFGLDDFIELNDVWMPNFLKNFDLSGNALDIFLIVNLVLFQDFDSHFFASECMLPQFDLPKSAFS